MRHVLPDVQSNWRTLGLQAVREVANHVHQDLLATGLQVDGGHVAVALVDGRELRIAVSCCGLEPLTIQQGLVALHHVVPVVAKLAFATPADVGPWAQRNRQ